MATLICLPYVYSIGDPIFVRNFMNGPTWISGNIKEKRGPLSYTVILSDGPTNLNLNKCF